MTKPKAVDNSLTGVIGPPHNQHWYYKGLRHREDGPAVMAEDHQAWYRHGKVHREDGPAVVWYHGGIEWWLNDKNYQSMEEWAKELGIYGTDDFTMIKLIHA